MLTLDGKVVVITGGAGLIGRSFVSAVVQAGGTAVVGEVDLESAGIFCRELGKKLNSDKCYAVEMNIAEKNSIRNAIEKVVNKSGKIDALVNNAYPKTKNFGAHFFDVEYDDFCSFISLNLGGYFLTSQQFSEYFKNRGEGNIINISSIQGVVAPAFETYEKTNMTTPVAYTATKSALIGLSRYMAKYFQNMNIRVNCISPGGILDGQPEEFLKRYRRRTMNKGMLDAEDLNGALIYLLSDSSRYVTGHNLIVDDGFVL